MAQDQDSDTRFPPAAHLPGEQANWVVGVLENQMTGQQALQGALQAGFAADDVILLHGQEALDRAQAQQEQMHPVSRFFASLARPVTDPGTAEQEYLEEAGAGRSILSVRASTPDQVALAQRVFAANDARRVKYFSEWTITDLSQPGV